MRRRWSDSIAAVAMITLLAPEMPAAQSTRPAPATAQQAAPGPEPVAPPQQPLAPLMSDRDAREVREQLRQIFDQYPPGVRQVLQLDPSLIADPAYLTPYPALARFIAEHPQVAHNPAFFVGTPEWEDRNPAGEAVRLWENFSQGVIVLLVFTVVSIAVVWLSKALIDYRRWLRLSRVQAEVHTKLLDRFTTPQELMAYVETPAGRRFLESAPIPLEAAPPRVGAPLGRILWSLQAGIVIACLGFGFLVVSRWTIPEVSSLLSVVGVLTLTLGAGFVLSAGAAWALSKQLGLVRSAAASDDAHAGVSG